MAPPDVFEEVERLQATHTLASFKAILCEQGLGPGGRAKRDVALHVARLQRAMRLFSAGGEDAQSPPRFDTARAGRVLGPALDACRLCRGPIARPRRTFCCDECVHVHRLRTSGGAVRSALAVRDRGVCAGCGCDAEALYRAAAAAVREALRDASSGVRSRAERRALGAAALQAHVAAHAPRFAKHVRLGQSLRFVKVSRGSFWHADHVVAMADGGGSCALANLRTLCTPCHAAVTRGQNTSWQTAKRSEGRPLLRLS